MMNTLFLLLTRLRLKLLKIPGHRYHTDVSTAEAAKPVRKTHSMKTLA